MNRRTLLYLAGAATLTVASGCGVLDLQDDEREQYEAARAQWERTRPDSYAATMERLCFCKPEAKGPVVVTVTGTTVVRRVYANNGQEVPADIAPSFPSIDGLFDLIEDALDQGVDEVQVFYDPATGIPFSMWIDYDKNVADEEAGYKVTVPLGSADDGPGA